MSSEWPFEVSCLVQEDNSLQEMMQGYGDLNDDTADAVATTAVITVTHWYSGVVSLSGCRFDADRVTLAGTLRPIAEFDGHEQQWTFVMALLSWVLGNVYRVESKMLDGFRISLSRQEA